MRQLSLTQCEEGLPTLQQCTRIMETSAPWLQKSFFEDILNPKDAVIGDEGSSVTVISCKTEPGVDAGRNFMSIIDRVTVDFKTEKSEKIVSRSFVIKSPLSNTNINESHLVENELQMYNEVIPKMTEITGLCIFPKRYKCSIPHCLVMEDLKEAKYIMCDSIKKLDYKHTKAALIALAKFHAASIIVKHRYPELIEQSGKEMVYSHDPKYANRFKPRILMRLYAVAKVLQTINGCERFGDILLNAREEFWDLSVEVFKPISKINVLNHGDFWTNNIMFKYDNTGNISDVKFVDFQICRLGSPAIDLLYLFWTSTDLGARMRMYELLEMYRHTFNGSLAEHGCSERLSRQELKEHISKCSPVILLVSLFLPVIFPDPEHPFDVSKIEASEESMTSTDFDVNPILIPFKQKYYRNALPEICKELEDMKIFQVLMKNKKYEN